MGLGGDSGGGSDGGDLVSGKTKRLRMRERIGFVVGVVLLAGAAAYLISEPEQLGKFVEQVKNAPAWAIAIVLVGPILNWVCVGLCLHALVRRHGEVGRLEMLALVGSAWLLNHLPMRPGLIGRIGYHAKINSIRVRDSIEASVWSVIHAAIANAIALGLVLIVPTDLSLGMLVGVLLLPTVIAGVLGGVLSISRPRLGLLLFGFVYRGLDLFVWMARYAAAFAMLGIEVRPVQIVLITAASQFAQLIPLTGAGLGFREWGVGIAAKMSGSGSVGTLGGTAGAGLSMRSAIGADVINRIAETLIVIPLGLVCSGIVAKRYAAGVGSGEDQISTDSLSKDPSADHAEDEDDAGETGEDQPAEH